MQFLQIHTVQEIVQPLPGGPVNIRHWVSRTKDPDDGTFHLHEVTRLVFRFSDEKPEPIRAQVVS